MRTDIVVRERGMALISSLLLLATAAVITLAAVQLSQLSAFETSFAGERNKIRYKAEGAANILYFCLKTDIAANPERDILPDIYKDTFGKTRWQADGVERVLTVNGEEYNVSISDCGGLFAIDESPAFIDFAEKWKLWSERDDGDFDRHQQLGEFADMLVDYCDSGDDSGLNGAEADFYKNSGMASLPRNANMQFLEELAYIPGSGKYFATDSKGTYTDLQPVAPNGLPAGVFTACLYSTPVYKLSSLASLSEREEELLREALEAWRKEKQPLEDSLEPELLSRLEAVAPAVESGLYTLRVEQGVWRFEIILRMTGGSGRKLMEFYRCRLP